MAKVNIKGLDRLRIKLAFMSDPQGVKKGIREAAVHLQKVAKEYPPKPPQSTYVRTRNLGHRWAVNMKPFGASVSNNTDYGPFVQGEKQTWYHKATGWKTTDTIADEEQKVVLKYIQDAVDDVLRK